MNVAATCAAMGAFPTLCVCQRRTDRRLAGHLVTQRDAAVGLAQPLGRSAAAHRRGAARQRKSGIAGLVPVGLR
ncbi:hypothetical protein DGM85_00565 [Xanthomonas phaseoli pv. phaseoli]|nr:hypothetical protein DGM93_22125 [Xanthomonas phaseoli pv. phaseoli]QWN30918.1 hypothetical protein DGM85_00565 [Xanthomonas phaseoli pv. phaseoli]QWN35375.1 hypothetical protein DGM81_21885 [Xanthomonas phaseoli pv. phaseoli]